MFFIITRRPKSDNIISGVENSNKTMSHIKYIDGYYLWKSNVIWYYYRRLQIRYQRFLKRWKQTASIIILLESASYRD